MSESDERRREGLAAMLADALVDDFPEADALLRYASDPDALEPSERARIEDFLAASPAHRQQLRSLLRFAETREGFTERLRAETEGDLGRATIEPISSHPRWRRVSAWIGAAVAAGLVAFLLSDMGGDPGTKSPPPARIAAERSSATEAPPSPDIATPRPEPVAQQAMADRVEEPQLALEEEASAEPPAPEPGVQPPSAPAPAPAPEPMLLASHVAGPLLYTRPHDAMELAPLGGLRGTRPGLPELEALAPAHEARTLSERPSFYWYVSEATDRSVEFVLADRVSIDPLLELALPPPFAAGFHVVHLGDHGVALEPGKPYRWFVTLAVGDGAGPEDLVARGAVLRVEADADLARALRDAGRGELGRIYAEHGLWYDTLHFISERVEHAPGDARLRAFRAGLLEGAGLGNAAEYDRLDLEAHGSP